MPLVATTLNIKVMEIKLYQLNIILMKLSHTSVTYRNYPNLVRTEK